MGAVLLLMTTAVITYGWQPAKDGGVDYIIQVSPDQVEEFQSGEISSVVDPAIRGQVTRVIVRVGTDPLPKIAPPRIAATGLSAADVNADHQAVPIPNIDDSAQSVVMKPDPNNGGTFALPPSMTKAGAGVQERMRNISDDMKAAAQNGLRTTQATLGGGAQSPQSGMVSPVSGNEPQQKLQVPSLASRADHWGDKQNLVPRTQTNTTRQFVGPPDLRSQFQNTAQSTNDRYPKTNTNLAQNKIPGATSTFGKLPDRVRFPSTDPPSTQAQAPAANTMQLTYEQKLALYQQEQARLAQQRRQTAAPLLASTNMTLPQTNNQTMLGAPQIATTHMAQTAMVPTQQQQQQLALPAMTKQNEPVRDVDPRLSKADADKLPYGGWSFDEFENPIDRQGRILDRFGRPVSPHRVYELTVGKREKMQQANRSQTQTQLTSNNSTPQQNQQNLPLTRSPSDQDQRELNRAGMGLGLGGGADSDEAKSKKGWSNAVYSWLLIGSIVANIYLIHWFWRTQNRYRNLIITKRTSAADGYATS